MSDASKATGERSGWRELNLPRDPLTWNVDDLSRFIASQSSVPDEYAKRVVLAVIDNHLQEGIGGLLQALDRTATAELENAVKRGINDGLNPR